jgi:sigma-B regulation protein RsbU (phosphoserine phosphatase)
MAITQSLIRLTLREGGDLGQEIARVNNLLAASNEESMFATAFCAVIDVNTGEITYGNCGHNPPLLLQRDGTLDQLTPTGPPLAVSAVGVFRTARRSLAAGDRLILFSDGLPEATNRNGDFFGDERFERAIRECAEATAQDMVRGVISRVTEFESGAQRYDDIACVSLLYRGAAGN